MFIVPDHMRRCGFGGMNSNEASASACVPFIITYAKASYFNTSPASILVGADMNNFTLLLSLNQTKFRREKLQVEIMLRLHQILHFSKCRPIC